ncbi:MAG: S41 family peptidase [Phycisphaerae bacterium]
MKRLSSELRGWLVGGAVLLAVWVAFAGPATRIAVVSKSDTATGVGGAKLRTLGIENALAGKFSEGLEQLRQAAKAVPDDEIAGEAVKLLSRHLAHWERVTEERAAEYNEAVQRVHHSKTAQAYVEKADEGRLEKLRKPIKDIGSAYNDIALADDLEEAADKAAAGEIKAMKSRSVEALDKVAEALGEAVKGIEGQTGSYAEIFRSIAAEGERLLKEHRAIWKGLSDDDAADWRAVSRALKDLEYRQQDVLMDLENMTVDKPWRLGLVQARLASRLAADRGNLASEPWFVDFVAGTEARAREWVDKAEWYDALSAYIALKELLPDNEDYEEKVKTVQRHVRVLGLYGRETPTTRKSNDEEPHWREVVANVDADMVEKVIGQLNLNYVSSVDYRKVTLGGLRSVKVLAETPQAGNSFKGLKDDSERKEFLKSIDRQIRDVERRDRVTHLDLILALNSVLRASEETVDLPIEVLAVEFTDGFLDELDKFSSMIWPYDVPNFEKQTMGHFCGVGIQIAKEPGEPLRVVTPLIGTPAFRAGIKAGDLIVEVNGKKTEKQSIDTLVKEIMGDKGTKVVMAVKRAGRTKEYSIIRDRIHIRTVKGWKRQPKTGEWDYLVDSDDRIGYIRVTQFTSQTAEHVATAFRQLQASGARSVVLDLRFNPGGLLSSAARVANEFLLAGLIVSTRGRNTKSSELNANTFGRYLDGDLVVLVNQYSASAAEIVSGALKDWHRARIVGQRTYGKGSVQNVISIRRHAARLKLTTAYYYLPGGRLLHRKNGAKDWGVDPDIEVYITPRQTRRWLDIRRKTDIVQDVQAEQLGEELARQYEADIQLDTAVLMLKLMRLRHRSAA